MTEDPIIASEISSSSSGVPNNKRSLEEMSQVAPAQPAQNLDATSPAPRQQLTFKKGMYELV
jgi:hypothetical protein